MHKKEKRGQVTVFIVIAIVILVLILFFSIRSKSEKISIDVKPMHNFIESCVQDITEESILHVAERGGYFIAPEGSAYNKFTFYYDKGKTSVPSKEKIQEELEEYVNNMLFFCTHNFNDFSGFNVTQGDIETKAVIEDNLVGFKIKYPISIKKDKETSYFENFENEVPCRLNKIYESVNEIIEIQKQYENEICFDCNIELAENNDLYIEMFDYEDDSIIFTVKDVNVPINDRVLEFNFVNKYDLGNEI